MKKILIVCFCLLAGVLIYWLWPQYGSGYSEEQRRLWNERRALYPAAWVVETVSPLQDFSSPFYRDIAVVTGKDVKTTDVIMKEKRKKEKELITELERNRDRSGPGSQIELPVSVDVARLPLDGMTERETAERAASGDGNACLMMVQHILKNKDGSIELTWREKREVNQWLDRAAALNRPGIEFLKHFMEESWVFQKNNIREGSRHVGVKPDTKRTPGRSGFMECLKKGDYLLYRTAAVMMECDGFPKEYDRLIHEGLLDGAAQGRVECWGHLAALHFDRPEVRKKYFLRWGSDEINLMELRWDLMFNWLPASWRKGMIKGLFFCGIMDLERSQSMKNYRKAARYARQAAQQGDLTGMYWWLMSGITCSERFSAREWNDILAYSRILLESGYAPYIEIMEDAAKSMSYGRGILNSDILRSFYSKESYEEVWKKDSLASRGRIKTNGYIIDEVINMNDLPRTREKVRSMSALGLTDFLLKNLNDDSEKLFSRSSKEVQAYLLEQMEEWAAEGDIHAMYVLAGIYEKGVAVPADPGRAYALLKQILPESVKYVLMEGFIKNEGKPSPIVGTRESVSLKTAVSLKMARLVLDYPDFPGRNEKEAYDQALEVVRDKDLQTRMDLNYPALFYYILGQYNERGIGRPVDKQRALEFYRDGASRHQGCEDGVKRLSPAGGGEAENSGK